MYVIHAWYLEVFIFIHEFNNKMVSVILAWTVKFLEGSLNLTNSISCWNALSNVTFKSLNMRDRICWTYFFRCSLLGILWMISSNNFRSCWKGKQNKHYITKLLVQADWICFGSPLIWWFAPGMAPQRDPTICYNNAYSTFILLNETCIKKLTYIDFQNQFYFHFTKVFHYILISQVNF